MSLHTCIESCFILGGSLRMRPRAWPAEALLVIRAAVRRSIRVLSESHHLHMHTRGIWTTLSRERVARFFLLAFLLFWFPINYHALITLFLMRRHSLCYSTPCPSITLRALRMHPHRCCCMRAMLLASRRALAARRSRFRRVAPLSLSFSLFLFSSDTPRGFLWGKAFCSRAFAANWSRLLIRNVGARPSSTRDSGRHFPFATRCDTWETWSIKAHRSKLRSAAKFRGGKYKFTRVIAAYET